MRFLRTAVKCLTKFERRSLVKAYPSPDVDIAYTPNMDEYLKPFIQGITTPGRPLKEMCRIVCLMCLILCALSMKTFYPWIVQLPQPRKSGSLPTPGTAKKTLVQAGHVTP